MNLQVVPYLWCHVVWCANPAAGFIPCRVNGQAKVTQYQLAAFLKEHILWFDVPVDDATAVKVLQHVQERDDNLDICNKGRKGKGRITIVLYTQQAYVLAAQLRLLQGNSSCSKTQHQA